MIMPNIAAFIAWGLITAFFIDDGLARRTTAIANDRPGRPDDPYLLPILIAYTGGRMVYGVRGGVVAAPSIGAIMATVAA